MADETQQGTVAEVATAMTVQFQRVTAFPELPGGGALDEDAEARLLGTDAATLRAMRAGMRATVGAAVDTLAADADVRAAVERLPQDFSIVAAGDSLTADHQSWAEIVAGVLAALRPDVRLINVGKSGDTTMDLVRRLGLALGDRTAPLFVVLIGTNDACRTFPYEGGTFLSDDETRAQLARLAQIIAWREGRIVWITPPPLLEDVVASFPVFEAMAIRYTREDVAAKAALVRERGERVIDLWETFADDQVAELVQADGLHLSAAGQAAVARRVLLEGLNQPG